MAPCKTEIVVPHKGRRSHRFERFADDAVVHCVSRQQAEQVRAAIEDRMVEVGLRLHPDKTKIVYCQDANRRGSAEQPPTGTVEPGVTARHAATAPTATPEIKTNSPAQRSSRANSDHREILRHAHANQ
jgi:Reverse transcriptase (RNA-dependent DNA polymerase)